MAHAARVGRAAQPATEVDVNNIAYCLLDIKHAMRLCCYPMQLALSD
jgi:hypothetical protein